MSGIISTLVDYLCNESFTQNGSRASLIFIARVGPKYKYGLRFVFTATNNEVENEAIIVDLKICKTLEAKNVGVYSHS